MADSGSGRERLRRFFFAFAKPLPDALGPAHHGVGDGVGDTAQHQADEGADGPGGMGEGPIGRVAPEAAQYGVAIDGNARL